MSEIKDVTKIAEFLFSLEGGSSDKVDKSIAPPTPSFHQCENSESNDVTLTDEINNEKSKEQRLKELERLRQQGFQYEKKLDALECCLLKYLAECEREKMNLSYTIENLKIPGSKERKELVVIPKAKVIALHKFTCSPYFKTISGYPAPANADTRNRDTCNWLLATMITPSTHWNNEEKRKLEKSLLTLLLESKQDVVGINEKKSGKRSFCREIEGILARSSFKIGSSAQEIKQALYSEVGDQEEEYDWLRISISYLEGIRSAHECRAIWFNYLHPKIKKAEWLDEEEEKLKSAAEENRCQNWDKIAKDMGTGRSPYQCYIYYHFQLEEISHEWNALENMKLQKIVEKTRFEEMISWRKVSYFFERLNGSDVFYQWIGMFANVKKGKFSKEEDIILCFGLKKYGPKWSEIAEYFPDRQNIQLRGRHHVLQGRDLEVRWTSCDDDLLQTLIQKYGWGMWSKISEHFLNRTPAQIRSRSLSLMRRQTKIGTGVESRALPTVPRNPPESRKIADILRAAVGVLERERIATDHEEGDKHVMDRLSEVLKVQKRRGRKQGQIIDCVLTNQFRNFFFMGSEQRGGRGKNTCLKSALPDMAFDLIATLTVLEAQIYLPTDEENISSDNTMSKMDKDVVQYLIQMKEKIEGKDSVLKLVSSGDVKNIYIPIETVACANDLRAAVGKSINAIRRGISFPPTLQNLLGIRTLLLCQQHLKEQSKGISMLQQYNHSKSSDSASIPAFSARRVLGKTKKKNPSKAPIINAIVIPPSLTSIPTGSSISCSSSTASTLCLTPVVAGSAFPEANSLTACEVRLIANRLGPIASVGNELHKSNSLTLCDSSPVINLSPCPATYTIGNAQHRVCSTKLDKVSSTYGNSTPTVQDVNHKESVSSTDRAGTSASFPSTTDKVETSVSGIMGISERNESQSASIEAGSLVPLDADSNATASGGHLATFNDSAPLSRNEGLSKSLDKDFPTSFDMRPSNPSDSCHMATSGNKSSFSCTTSQSNITSSTISPSCSDSAAESSCAGKSSHSSTTHSNSAPFATKASSASSVASAFITPEMFSKIQFSHAAALFQKRFQKLFLWPSLFTLSPVPQEMKVEDINAFPDEEEETKQGDVKQEEDEGKIPEKNCKKGGRRRKGKDKKVAQKTDCNTEPNSEKPKRHYVKSGKYSRNTFTDQEVRKSTRKSSRKSI